MKGFIFTTIFLSCLIVPAYTQHTISFEVLSGPVYNFPSKLIVHQRGQAPIHMKARYRSEPFELPPYYDFRLSLWRRDSSAWGIKFTHHKLILDNPSGDVHAFEITHGYNIFSLTRIWKRKGFTLNVALGAVLANPESTIRGKTFQGGGLFNNGYYLSGFVGELAGGRRFKITKNWYLSTELRFTGAWAKVKVYEGYAEVPNFAAHLLIGTGFNILTRDKGKWKWGGI